MSALHSSPPNCTPSKRSEWRAGQGEWRDQALVSRTEDEAENEVAVSAAPGEDGTSELISPCMQWVLITVALIAAALVLVCRASELLESGWLS
jgi:hypothetical protein